MRWRSYRRDLRRVRDGDLRFVQRRVRDRRSLHGHLLKRVSMVPLPGLYLRPAREYHGKSLLVEGGRDERVSSCP
ncbi:MAG TPA: hypothetical protein VGS07_22715 [Thermoanaerobaculia bacterium]|nr:hypothetical protein [Thermoanaerobaculia bacterium]